MTTELNGRSPSLSEAEREKVREQMNRLLETHHFKNSKRYPALLRFIVEETLEGRGEFLKERLLGVRVFDRPADYDTASDPIVRVTIAEIRKRIAQYYHDEEHDAEIRIELLPGRYEPEFRSRREAPVVPTLATEGDEALSIAEAAPSSSAPVGTTTPTEVSNRKSTRRKLWYLLGAAAVLLLAVASAGLVRWLHPPALELLWSPVLTGEGSVLFCLPTDVGAKRGPTGDPVPDKVITPVKTPASQPTEGQTFLAHEALGENVVYSDMLAALRVANVMAVHHHPYIVRLTVSTTLGDLRQGPAVLIGGLDNQWTIRSLSNLRYRFAGSDEKSYWILDKLDPDNQRWSLDLKEPIASVTRDYAIVARLHNEQTGQAEMIVAGIGMTGTAAAGEFISDEHRAEELRQRLGSGLKDKDFEVVLSTDVVNGIAGAAKIEAVAVW